jgi:hypothetical protein
MLSIRLSKAQNAWLEHRATRNNRSLNAEVLSVLDEKSKEDPLTIIVHDCNFKGMDQYFSVSVGANGRDFFESPDKAQAIEIAKSKAEELGLGRGAIAFNTETSIKAENAV